jgi:hypothetical protein
MNLKRISIGIYLLFIVTHTPAQAQLPSPNPAANATQPLSINKTYQPFTQADLTIITGNTQRPNGMAWHNEKLYTICSGDGTVYEIDAQTGETSQYIYGVQNAHTLIAQESDTGLTLWIPDFETNTLILIQQGITKVITNQLDGPWGIAQLNNTSFIITNLRSNNATVVDTEGNSQEAITQLRSPSGISIDNDYLYIANSGSSRRAIEWFLISDIENKNALEADRDGHPLVTGLQNVTNIVLGQDGLLYFAYALGTRGVVGRIDPKQCLANGCNNDQVENVIYTELPAPLAGLTLSPDMRLYIHSMFSPDLYWVQLPTKTKP